MQCTCDACSEKRYSEERKRFNTFKRLFRVNNWFFHRQGGEKYYKSVRSAYQAHITGNTIDKYLNTPFETSSVFIKNTAMRRKEKYHKHLRAANQAQTKIKQTGVKSISN